jgi:hypothetical protein
LLPKLDAGFGDHALPLGGVSQDERTGCNRRAIASAWRFLGQTSLGQHMFAIQLASHTAR